MHPAIKPLPLWWRNACVSYDLQKNASRQVPYDVADKVVAAAFAKWTGVACPGAGGGESGGGRVSIDVRDLGPVSCGNVEYNSDRGNQHVIVFRDDRWPYDDPNNTLALTTMTFDMDTGEIYDADMEINGTVKLAASDSVPPGGYDFQSVVTHEAGHFLGMAHSGDERATMFAAYEPGTTNKRTLTADDEAGICSIYRPGGLRMEDPSLGGPVKEDMCDATPRHGFSKECSPDQSSGHAALALPRQREGGWFLGSGWWWSVGVGFAAVGLWSRSRRTSPRV
jgi:hypothetical protein